LVRAVTAVAAKIEPTSVVFREARIYRALSFRTFRTTVKKAWGDSFPHTVQEFCQRTKLVAEALKERVAQAGFPSDFNERQFYAAATLAVIAHFKNGRVHARKVEGLPYAFHMLRILERLLENDVPYLGNEGYIAAWLHDTLEDTALTREQIQQVFGTRVAGIVHTLSNFKVSKFQSKLELAEIYEPRFATEIRDYIEALYIKLADADDYFNTCEGMKDKSIFLHLRFINEVLYPLAVPVAGAQELALKVASKALRIQNPVALKRNTKPLDQLVDRQKFEDMATMFSSVLAEEGIEAQVNVVIRTPYEMYLKEKKTEVELMRKRQFLRRTIDGDYLGYADHEEAVGEIGEIEVPKRTLRDVVFYDIVAKNNEDGYRIKELLCKLLASIPKRSRDFIAHPKPNGYRGLHEEFAIEGKNHRVRIFTPEMQKVNRLGLAYKLFSSQGMSSFSSLLLSEEVLDMMRGSDREGRRQVMGRFTDVRQIQLQVVTPLPGLPSEFELPVWRQDTLLDVLTIAHPLLALRFSSARWQNIGWGVNNKLDPREGFDWFTGQRILLRLGREWTGHDPHTFLQNPLARRDFKTFIAEKLSRRTQIAIGCSMIGRALREPRYKVLRLSPDHFGTVLEKETDYLENELYQAIAIGEVSVFHIMQTLYLQLPRGA